MRDMTTGSPLRQIIAFFIPLWAGNLFQQFYTMADSFLVGQILGVDAFAAVGSIGSLHFLVLGLAIGACSGFAIPISQSFGAGDMDKVRSRCGQTVWLGIFMTVAITAFTLFYTDDMLRLTNTPADIFDDAYTYIFILFMGTGTTVLYNMVAAILRALGDSRTPLYFLMVATVVNIVLDWLFMAPMHMDVAGAALATVLSQAFSGVACIFYIYCKMPQLRLSRNDLRPDWPDMGRIAYIGFPMGFQYSITAIGTVVLQSAINSLGTTAVAAITLGGRVIGVVTPPMDSLGVALATYAGQNIGAGKPERIRKGIRQILVVSMVYCAAGFAYNYFLGIPVAKLFVDTPDALLMELTWEYLLIYGACYPLLLVTYVFRNTLQGMGYSNVAMLSGVAELIARTFASFVLVDLWGFAGVCWAGPLAWAAADGISFIIYLIKMRETERRLRFLHR